MTWGSLLNEQSVSGNRGCHWVCSPGADDLAFTLAVGDVLGELAMGGRWVMWPRGGGWCSELAVGEVGDGD